MLEKCELGFLPMGPFLGRALKMSPVFRQALCDIIIFLMNRKSRNDDYSVFHVYDSSGFQKTSFIHSLLWKSSQLAPFCIQGLTVLCFVVCSGFYSHKCGWLAHGVCGFSSCKEECLVSVWDQCSLNITASQRVSFLYLMTKKIGGF